MHHPTEKSLQALKRLTVQDWRLFGAQYLAYIRPVVQDGVKAYGVYAADGDLLGILENETTGAVFAQEQSLMPMTVH
ncbi:MAG: hypothetical protein H6868_01275 [Rhodospirillales bacterium]|nr:hypothetical protein [Rhodospirillales bacterium]